MRSKRMFLPILAVWGVLLISCSDPPRGVTSMSFALKPVWVVSWPEGVDQATFVSLPLATGTVSVDVADGMGDLEVAGLPSLPEGYEYGVTLLLAESERELLASEESGEEAGGHAHHSESGLVSVAAMSLAGAGDGDWYSMFHDDETEGYPLGALRAVTVAIVSPIPDEGGEAPPDVAVMHGEATAEEAASASESTGGGGHEH